MEKFEVNIEKPEREISYDQCETGGKQNCHHPHRLPVVQAVAASAPGFDSVECETKFRRALRNVPSKAFIRNAEGKLIIYMRPENLLQFGASVNRQGLEQCEATRKILRYLDKYQTEFLKFEHPAKK